MADFAIEFHTLASQSTWNSPALISLFVQGLVDHVKDALVVHETPDTLDGVIDLAIRIDLQLQARRRERRRLLAGWEDEELRKGALNSSREVVPEPMQIGKMSLSRAMPLVSAKLLVLMPLIP